MAAPLADEIGESLGVMARHYRYKLALKMFQKTARMLKDARITPNAIPPRLFLPIVEHASVEDDDDLQTRWAALLANAAVDSASVHPSHIEILSQLTPEEARLLNLIYDACELHDTDMISLSLSIQGIEYDRIAKTVQVFVADQENNSFHNLVRLGLIASEYGITKGSIKVGFVRGTPRIGSEYTPPEIDNWYQLTSFAKRFINACRAPKVKPSNDIVP